ncbi:DUF2971 domain-containing protein [Vibrio coralliilyticus]|uniref:DUF2971 domain-containing protein n=1 Tax=Vibrio coralliilyticus TaxID=190893 RepID=UPI00391735F2
MDDKKIANMIRSGSYSKLTFLEDEVLLKQNDKYYGFLYFSNEHQLKSNKDVFDEIVKIKGSLSDAYEYIGTVALDIYNGFDERYVPESFFRLSISEDKNNESSWWNLYLSNRKVECLLESLKIDYKNEDFESIANKVYRTGHISLVNADLEESEWKNFQKIIEDKRIESSKSINEFLIVIYYHVKRYDDGMKLIKEVDYIDVDIILKYRDLGKVSDELLVKKVYEFQLKKLFGKNYNNLYDEYYRRYGNIKKKITKKALVSIAFDAKRYDDVIKIYREKWEMDVISVHDVGIKLYYLISQLYLDMPLDEEVHDFVAKKSSNDKLFKLFEFKKLMVKLRDKLSIGKKVDIPIELWGDYQEIENILEGSELVNHHLYSEIHDELDSLKRDWDKVYFGNKLKSIKSELESGDFSYERFEEFCHYGIENEHYLDVLERIEEFHEANSPTISTLNCLGVCCERMSLHQEAFSHYEKAAEIMNCYNEFDPVVISNYLKSSVLSGNEIPKVTYGYWREKINTSLVNSFQWNMSLASGKGSLYKYSSFNLNTLDSLINQYFYLPEKKQLNDPIEMPDVTNIGPSELIDSDYRICSFSKNSNSILMWSHYTENHQGIMVEYQFRRGIPNGFGIGEVKYTNDEKRNIEKNKYIFNQYLLTKNKEWSYEEEVRLMSYKLDKIYYSAHEYPNPDRSKLNVRILSITLGCNFDPSKLQLMKNLVKSINEKAKEHEPKVELKQARISANNMFGLEYILIDV